MAMNAGYQQGFPYILPRNTMLRDRKRAIAEITKTLQQALLLGDYQGQGREQTIAETTKGKLRTSYTGIYR
jgi:hypothetical protein